LKSDRLPLSTENHFDDIIGPVSPGQSIDVIGMIKSWWYRFVVQKYGNHSTYRVPKSLIGKTRPTGIYLRKGSYKLYSANLSPQSPQFPQFRSQACGAANLQSTLGDLLLAASGCHHQRVSVLQPRSGPPYHHLPHPKSKEKDLNIRYLNGHFCTVSVSDWR
jgi:hypothetical protein